MRTHCEACHRPQPREWQPGDLCIHCGGATREEMRCHWCVRWGPRAAFCRNCGSAAASRAEYGPARMLKQLGASVFEIPRLLRELPQEQIDTYASLYAVHAAALEAHLADAHWLGRRLYQSHWAERLEEEYTPQLPWPDDVLRRMSRAEPPVTANEIAEAQRMAASPIPLLAELALLVRLRLGDFTALRAAEPLLFSGDAEVAAEAALQLSGWRVLFAGQSELRRHELTTALQRSPLPQHAAPRLAVLGVTPEKSLTLTGDVDTDLLIHIHERHAGPLREALVSPDAQLRFTAAGQLLRLEDADGVEAVLATATAGEQLDLMNQALRQKRPRPAWNETLFAIVNGTTDARLRRTAARVLCLSAGPGEAMRLLRESAMDSGVVHALLQQPFEPELYREIGEALVRGGAFRTSQWGMDAAAKPEAMPADFVPEIYPHADDDTRRELLRFAEMQIEARAEPGTPLERFVIRQCFAAAPAAVVGAAWASMHRIQMHRRVGLRVPCEPSPENLAWCWTVPEWLEAIATLLEAPEAVRQTFVRDDFDRFLRGTGAEMLAAAAPYGDLRRRIATAVPIADPYLYAARFSAALDAAATMSQ